LQPRHDLISVPKVQLGSPSRAGVAPVRARTTSSGDPAVSAGAARSDGGRTSMSTNSSPAVRRTSLIRRNSAGSLARTPSSIRSTALSRCATTGRFSSTRVGSIGNERPAPSTARNVLANGTSATG
jgi:hypothetical protein